MSVTGHGRPRMIRIGTWSVNGPLHRGRHGALLGRGWLWAPLDRRVAMQVGFDRRGDVGEALAVDLQVLHDTLDVVARLGERNALNPIDSVDLGIARIPVP